METLLAELKARLESSRRNIYGLTDSQSDYLDGQESELVAIIERIEEMQAAANSEVL